MKSNYSSKKGLPKAQESDRVVSVLFGVLTKTIF